MSRTCTRAFDEALITGYIDGVLPQTEAQKVRLHLEDCASCRALYDELAALRNAARETSFRSPDTWPELPKTTIGRLSRSFGCLLLGAWLVVVSGLAVWRLWTQNGDPLELFLVLGLPGAFVLLFLSVLLDRLQELKTDPYRDVHR